MNAPAPETPDRVPSSLSPESAQPAPRRAWPRALRIVLTATAALAGAAVLGVLALVAWLASPAALRFAMDEIAARSGGALRLEGAQGSLLSTLMVRSLAYRDGGLSVVAEDVTLDWSPVALASRTLRVRSLGAQRITITTAGDSGPTSLPSTLALPLIVAVDRAAVGELTLVSGDRKNVLRRVALGYRGDATAHTIRDASVTTDAGRVSGALTLAATTPFATSGTIELEGSERWRELKARVDVAGRLDALDVALSATAFGAKASGSAQLTPLAPQTLPGASLAVEALDLAAIDASLPRTAIAGTLTAALGANGSLAGRLAVTNSLAGPYDQQRLPLSALSTRYVLASDVLDLTELAGEAGPRAKMRGAARIPLAQSGAFGSWRLELAQVDLARLHTALIATQLSGQFDAELAAAGQVLKGDLAQNNLGLSFAARVTGTAVDVPRFRLRAGPGRFDGRAQYEAVGSQRFRVEGQAVRFDPAAFGRFPAGRLDGQARIAGELAPRWKADASITLAPSSRLRDAPVSGDVRGRFTATDVKDVFVDVRLAGALLQATGSAGAPDSRLEANLDVPDLARLRALLAEWTPEALHSTEGRVRGKATLTGARDDLALALEAHGQNLRRDAIAIGTLNLRGEIGAPSQGRPLTVGATATKLETPVGNFASVTASLNGTLAAHALTLALVGEDVDANLRLDGGVADSSWRGTLSVLRNRGTVLAELAAPARLEVGPGTFELADARLAIAEGSLRVSRLRWAQGRLASEGAFDAVPLAALTKIAGTTLPLRSTLVLGGEWKLDAAPRLNGTLSVRRQGGDLYAGAAGGTNAAGAKGARVGNGADGSQGAGEVALGISTLELKANAADDAIDATLDARATRFGAVRGNLTVGRGGDGAVGRIDGNATLSGSLVAELASLQPLQPFIGTAARVDGRLDARLKLAGTPREAEVTGTLNGTGLKLDAPVYGLHWADGVLRARLDERHLTLDEFSFSAGDGRFRASGVVAAARKAGDGEPPVGAGTEINWRADRLRATNRPDLRLVVSGGGKLAFADRHLAVSGALKVDEGSVDVEDRAGSALGADVVIVGRPRPPPASAKRFGAIPFGVDLEVDLGPNLTVTGEGLETLAAGKVRVSATPDSVLTAKGTIRAVKGSYFAFGQRLSIERGRLIFDGPIDNPALDVVALRKHLQVEAGVKVTGTVKVPRVELTSEPPVPEGEKLSWLVLGQGLNQATSGADTAALQAAAATLFGGGRVPLGTTLARQIGLDDISVRGSSSMAAVDSTTGGANNQVVAVGKRLSDKLYVVYEQGLSVANNALKIEYALTRRITLRAEAGLISGVGIYYRRSFN